MIIRCFYCSLVVIGLEFRVLLVVLLRWRLIQLRLGLWLWLRAHSLLKFIIECIVIVLQLLYTSPQGFILFLQLPLLVHVLLRVHFNQITIVVDFLSQGSLHAYTQALSSSLIAEVEGLDLISEFIITHTRSRLSLSYYFYFIVYGFQVLGS
jgi:hypothetical protein